MSDATLDPRAPQDVISPSLEPLLSAEESRRMRRRALGAEFVRMAAIAHYQRPTEARAAVLHQISETAITHGLTPAEIRQTIIESRKELHHG